MEAVPEVRLTPLGSSQVMAHCSPVTPHPPMTAEWGVISKKRLL